MTKTATEITVFDVIKSVLPDGTNGEGTWNAVCQWPPDLFAAMAVVTDRSGLYAEGQFTSYWIGDRFVPTKQWIEETREIGREWVKAGRPPEKVEDRWRELYDLVQTLRIDDEEIQTEAWKKIVFQLLAIADESCAGIGFSVPPLKADQFNRADSASSGSNPTSIQFLFQKEYQAWSNDPGVIGSKLLPFLPHSLCIWVPPEMYCVQPKSSTPVVGYTLRSLTHHLALLPSVSNVTTHWHVAYERGEEPHAFNVLLVPFPYSIPGKSFRPVNGKFPGNSKDRAFKLDPHLWTQHSTPEEFAKFLEQLVEAAEPEMEPVNAIVLPEAALPLGFAKAVAEALSRDRRLDLFVTGVVTSRGENAQNSAAIFRFVNGMVMDFSFQSKHHRWGLDCDQICRYQLGHILDPHYKWWEQIDVSHRECHVMQFRSNATLSVLICEDLARYDPVLTVMNAIGPNLVIALLMDGPQLEQRWPGRYATVLADDPGSAVLTLTSLGMVARSSMPADPQSREIALWKEPTGKARPLRLPKGDHALLLTLTSRMIEQFTLDGRSDGGATVHFALGAAHPVRHPAPPWWLGRPALDLTQP